MRPIFFHSLVVGVIVAVTGCQSTPRALDRTAAPVATPAGKADLSARNNALALLHDLLGDEKDVAKVLYLKSASDATTRLLKDISVVSKEYYDDIEAVTRQFPGYDVKILDLPPGEVAAREAESKTQEHAILHSHGAEFEFQILLSQAQALDYGTHLARVIAANETDAFRIGEFSALTQKLNALYERDALLLKNKH